MPWPAKPPDEVSTVFGTLICGGTFDGAPRWASKRGVDVVVNCREVGGGVVHLRGVQEHSSQESNSRLLRGTK
jgi:hypothetical protein